MTTTFAATFDTTYGLTKGSLLKRSVTVQIRDRTKDGKSFWNDKYSDRLIEDLITVVSNCDYIISVWLKKDFVCKPLFLRINHSSIG